MGQQAGGEGEERPESSSSSGLTIQEFLTRYPEVKRLSSRFNEDGEDILEDVTTVKPKKQKNNKKSSKKTTQPTVSPFLTSGEVVLTEIPVTVINITPKQRQVPVQTTEAPAQQQQQLQLNHQQQKPQQSQQPQHQQQQANRQQQQQALSSRPNVNASLNQRPHHNQQPQGGQEPQDPAEYDNPFDYDYYYDQLVPEHERFFQLPKTAADPVAEEPAAKNEPFQVFTHFAIDSTAGTARAPPPLPPVPSSPGPEQERGQKAVQASPPKQPKAAKAPKVTASSPNSIGSPAKEVNTGNMAGPFGYTEKGTFFIDDQTTGFPEKIEMVYQGFVWAFDVSYPDQNKVRHGGVHRILEDKVKRESLDLRNDHVVRITGRASPYNINRLTLYTASGRQFGPWGDRHSDESTDFEVTAPAGHALAFFSGTIDFGVPLRSVSFHWRPL